jgi:hypothetical protein
MARGICDIEDVSATRAFEIPRTQTASVKYVCQSMSYDKALYIEGIQYCCKLANHRDAKRFHVNFTKLQAVRPNLIIGRSPCC